MSVELSQTHQSCRDCCFADYKPDAALEPGEKPTQLGCTVGKLDVFRLQNPTNGVVDAEDASAAFMIVNGRKCQFYRDFKSDWATKTPRANWSTTTRIEVIQRIDFIIVLADDDGDNATEILGNLGITLDSLSGQTIKPAKVIVVNNNSHIRAGQLQLTIQSHSNGLNIFRQDIFLRGEAANQRVPRLVCVDEAFSKLTGHFYALARAGFVFPRSFVYDIDFAINTEMAMFLVLEPVDDKDNALVVQRGFHKLHGGNFPGLVESTKDDGVTAETRTVSTIVEKAHYLIGLYERPNLVQKVTSICPSLLS